MIETILICHPWKRRCSTWHKKKCWFKSHKSSHWESYTHWKSCL